ncbi:hypothetical protein ACFYWP_25345 [Actinacidiphila glaucinigra]|uniref:hypothetical protein n=1 Tax=Actinacidiphila glaucinigra TaxID=235986 RepID=UPI0036A2D440
MSDVLLGLAGNPSLPRASVDRLIATADGELAEALAERPDLTRAQVVALAARDEGAALQPAYGGRLTAADVDPVARPLVALALLDERAGPPEWARTLACSEMQPRATAVALVACLDDGRARPVAAGHPALPPAVIVELLAEDDRQVACAAAANPALPPAEMTRLVH